MTAKITDNLNVIRAWKEGKNARNHKNTLLSVNGELYSYHLKIGQRSNSGLLVVGDMTSGGGGYHSQTTSCHVGLAKRFADTIMHAKVWVDSPFGDPGVPF